MADFQYVTEQDFVRGATGKINVAIGNIPVLYTLASDGNLTIKKKNGTEDVIQLGNFFALLGTVFDELLPGMAQPGGDEPGTVKVVDDEDPTQLESEQGVLSAAAVVRLIEAKLGVAGAKTLQALLDYSDTSNQSTTDIELYDGAAYVFKSGAFEGKMYMNNDRTIRIEYEGGKRIVIDDAGVKFFGDETYVAGLLTTNSLAIRNVKSVNQASELLCLDPDTDQVVSVPVNKLNAGGATAIGRDTNLVVKTLSLVLPSAFDGSPTLFFVGKQLANGDYDVQLATRSQLADSLAPIIADLIGTDVGGGSNEDGELASAGCETDYAAPSNEAEIVFDNTAFGTQIEHNLQTTRSNILITGVWRYTIDPELIAEGVAEANAYTWQREFNLDPYLRFDDDNHVSISAKGEGYNTLKLLVRLERLVKA